ncbi:MAG: hypothetical protein LBJ72_08485 [Dysgonamonadaceae bacterium]|jgi:hypothetical protein|nr:hypothetical protein [Dysgonamonadaceae bacterium]
MEFTKKNNFIVKNKDGKYFEKDRELFTKYFPNHRFHSDLRAVNSFSRAKLDGLMLFYLLDKITPEEILVNRQEVTKNLISKDRLENLLKENGLELDELPIGTYNILIDLTESEAEEAIKAEAARTLEEDPSDEMKSDKESALSNKELELEEKEEELTDKELELDEKEESLEEKAQELEDKEKELLEKEAELEKTSPKKKEANKKSSRK